MRIAHDDNNAVIVQPIASASTIVSSLTAEIREFISKQFPRGFFKHVHINTSEPVTNIRQNDLYNKDVGKHPYPRLIVTPEITLDDPIFGMDKHLHMSSPNMYLRKAMNRFYTPLLTDPDGKFSAHFTSDYVTINYNFQIIIDKFIQNIDLAYFLKSNFQNSMFKHLDGIKLNTEIPKTLVAIIAHLSGHQDMFDPIDEVNPVDVANRNGVLAEFEKYMKEIGHMSGLISKKTRDATGKVGFFADHDVTVTGGVFDLDVPTQINREGMNEGEYVITFRFQASTWIPNAFILSVKKDELTKKMDQEYLSKLMMDRQNFGILGIESDQVMTTSLRIGGLRKKSTDFFIEYDIDPETGEINQYNRDYRGEPIIGQEIVNEIYTFGYNEKIEPIDINNFISGDLRKLYIYALDNNWEVRDIINIRLEDEHGPLPLRTELDSKDPYSFVDYDNLKIHIAPGVSKDVNMRIFLNRPIYEAVIDNLNKSRYFSIANHLGFINIDIVDYDLAEGEEPTVMTHKVRVLAFKSRQEIYSDDPSMRLRVQTPWGPGYIETVPVYSRDTMEDLDIYIPVDDEYLGKEDEDGIKIVVGEYPNGDPIIRRLVTYEIIEHDMEGWL